jgi:hypothetical protein
MASKAEIDELRRDIAEYDNTAESLYTDEYLSAMLDSNGHNAAASKVWGQKAAALAHLVNTSEGGSTRANGELYKNALAMEARWRVPAPDAVTPATRRSTTRRAERR